jgi:C1A family cysteine protease
MHPYGLGRRYAPDRRDHRFLMPRLDTGTITRRMWSSAGVLNQGSTSQCVAYSGFKYLTSGPVVNRHPKHSITDIYGECLRVDEWPGEDWDEGTSVRALFKALSGWGYVNGYKWAFDAERVVDHVLTTGPVVMGTYWYRKMFTPHPDTGYLEIGGEIDGGHAWLIVGADRNRKNPDGSRGAVRMLNSWGQEWGQGGRAWLTFSTLDRLVKEDGEACVAAEIKISALEEGRWRQTEIA